MTKPPCGRSHASSRICRVSTSLPVSSSLTAATVRVDCGAPLGPLRRIWTSFGYDEINWTSTPTGKRHLKTIRDFAEQPYYVRSHYIFNSGIGWSLPHWGAGNVYHEDAAGRPFYDFSHRRPGLRRGRAAPGTGRWSSWRSRRARSCPTDAEKRLPSSRARPSGAPTRPGCGRRRRATTTSGAGSSARWSRTAWSATARSTCAAGCGSCGTSPTSSTGAAPPEQFYALYDVTAAAVKAALPDAAVGGPATTGDLGPGGAATSSSAASSRTARSAGRPLDFVSFHTKGARFTPWRVYGPLGGPAPTRQSPSSLKMLREVRAALDAVGRAPERFATCRASWTSATPRCPPTGACTTTPTSRTATPSTFRSSSASS